MIMMRWLEHMYYAIMIDRFARYTFTRTVLLRRNLAIREISESLKGVGIAPVRRM